MSELLKGQFFMWMSDQRLVEKVFGLTVKFRHKDTAAFIILSLNDRGNGSCLVLVKFSVDRRLLYFRPLSLNKQLTRLYFCFILPTSEVSLPSEVNES